MGYIYFTGDYETISTSLTANNLSAAENVRLVVDEVNNQIEDINGLLVEWNGESYDSYVEVIKCMTSQFKNVSKNIAENLEPACKAADELVPKLAEFKAIDEEAYALKEAFEVYKMEPPKTKKNPNYDPNDSNSKEYINNDSYDDYIAKKTKYEKKLKEDQDIKKSCDDLIEIIKKLQKEIDDYQQIIATSLEENGFDIAHIKDFSEMTPEERKAFIDNLVENYKKLYDQLESYYKEHFGDGLPFDYDLMLNLQITFDLFGAYEYYGLDARADFLPDPETFSKLLEFCEKNKVFEKFRNYIDGDDWEESGLAELYKNRRSAYNGYGGFYEIDFLDKLNDLFLFDPETLEKFTGLKPEEYNYVQALMGPGNEENTTNFLRQFLKHNIDRFEGNYEAAKIVYTDYIKTLTSISQVKELYLEAVRSQYLLPCLERMNDKEYEAFYEQFMKNPGKYSGLDSKYLYEGLAKYNKTFNDYMTDEEKALYYYLKQSDNPKLAEDYLNGIHNELNKLYAQDVAKQFITDHYDDNCIELFGSCFLDGGEDGVEGFIGGCKAWFNGDHTLLGDNTALDYVQQYKTAYLIGNLENMSSEEREKFQAYIDTLGGTKGAIAKEFYSTGSTVGYMAIPMTLALATQGLGSIGAFGMTPAVAEGLAQWSSSALLGFSAGGNAKDAALSMGANVETARGYGALTAVLETVTEAGPAMLFKVGGVMPGMSFTEGATQRTLKEAFKASGVTGVIKEIGTRSTPALKDVLGEGVQEIFQRGVENVTYDAYYDLGAFDTVINDRKDITEGMVEDFWEAIKATGVVRGGYGAMTFAINPSVNTLMKSFMKSGTDTTAPATNATNTGNLTNPTNPSNPEGPSTEATHTLSTSDSAMMDILKSELNDAVELRESAQAELDDATSRINDTTQQLADLKNEQETQQKTVKEAETAYKDAIETAYNADNEARAAGYDMTETSDIVYATGDEYISQDDVVKVAEEEAARLRKEARTTSNQFSKLKGRVELMSDSIFNKTDTVFEARANLDNAQQAQQKAKGVVELSQEELKRTYEQRKAAQAELKETRSELRELKKSTADISENNSSTTENNSSIESETEKIQKDSSSSSIETKSSETVKETRSSKVEEAVEASMEINSRESNSVGTTEKASNGPTIEELGGPFDPNAYEKLKNTPRLRKEIRRQGLDTATIRNAYLDGSKDHIILQKFNGDIESISTRNRTYELEKGGTTITGTPKINDTNNGTGVVVSQQAEVVESAQATTSSANVVNETVKQHTEEVITQEQIGQINNSSQQIDINNGQQTQTSNDGAETAKTGIIQDIQSKIESLKGKIEQYNQTILEQKQQIAETKNTKVQADQDVKDAQDILKQAESSVESEINKYNSVKEDLASLEDLKNDIHEELIEKNAEVRTEQKNLNSLDTSLDEEINTYNDLKTDYEEKSTLSQKATEAMKQAAQTLKAEQEKLTKINDMIEQNTTAHDEAVNAKKTAQANLEEANKAVEAVQVALTPNFNTKTNTETNAITDKYGRTWEDVMDVQSQIETAEGTLGYNYDTILDARAETNTNTNVNVNAAINPIIHPYVDLPDSEDNKNNLYVPPINSIPITTPNSDSTPILDSTPTSDPILITNPTPPSNPGPGPNPNPNPIPEPVPEPEPIPDPVPPPNPLPIPEPIPIPTPSPDGPYKPHTGLDETYEKKGMGLGGLAAAAGLLAGVGGIAATAMSSKNREDEEDEEEEKEEEPNHYYRYDFNKQEPIQQSNINYNSQNNYYDDYK